MLTITATSMMRDLRYVELIIINGVYRLKNIITKSQTFVINGWTRIILNTKESNYEKEDKTSTNNSIIESIL